VLELFAILFGLTHIAACFWLFVARTEISSGATDTWYDAWEQDRAKMFEEYVDAVFWGTATMTSIGYGDIFPQTNVERGVSLLIMILGATTYAGLFGAFAVLIDSINEEHRESRLLLNQSKKWGKIRGVSPANV
jgi:hypothetical protein